MLQKAVDASILADMFFQVLRVRPLLMATVTVQQRDAPLTVPSPLFRMHSMIVRVAVHATGGRRSESAPKPKGT